ncbi:hypothetical protein FE391_16780 [Nonomuraea sp. KC401]|uniref:hypothetical protein n=1 Tax=unclassified Nonomuraea TaxID=2593643 RepID=UPI0010FCDFEC|nr:MULTISPECIES: hypothetical protein [unclassified Nonomuraea]NBE97592.1 hypothetical protein [Nonomuraea sp. K271]TLF72534.1 hypothetical protein FE391_16780 [Nonomuraea sp. KC401]
MGELISLACGRPADAATVAEIAERTGGNPFFVRETARLLDAEGVVAMPAGVRDVLRRRVARLPAQAGTILRQSAVIGRESDVDVLSAVSGADEESVLAAIESGLVTGLLCPTAQVLGDLAAFLGRPAEPHYREALEVGERADVRLWTDAARARLTSPRS